MFSFQFMSLLSIPIPWNPEVKQCPHTDSLRQRAKGLQQSANMAPWWPRICEWAVLTQPWCWAVLRIECMLRERSKGYRCGFAFWQYCFVFVLVVVEQRFVLLPTFGLVLFQLRKPSLIAIFHLILKWPLFASEAIVYSPFLDSATSCRWPWTLQWSFLTSVLFHS